MAISHSLTLSATFLSPSLPTTDSFATHSPQVIHFASTGHPDDSQAQWRRPLVQTSRTCTCQSRCPRSLHRGSTSWYTLLPPPPSLLPSPSSSSPPNRCRLSSRRSSTPSSSASYRPLRRSQRLTRTSCPFRLLSSKLGQSRTRPCSSARTPGSERPRTSARSVARSRVGRATMRPRASFLSDSV